MVKIELGWNSSDLLSGAVSDLCKKYPDNEPLKEFYKALAVDLVPNIHLQMNDDSED